MTITRTHALVVMAGLMLPMLAACDLIGDEGAVRVAAIGNLSRSTSDVVTGPQTGPDALIADATAQGLVSFAADGQVEAGLAERWTVIDGGRSYIFRLRDANWANGRPVRANDVAAILGMRLRGARLPMALRGELSTITSIRGMTNKVIEIELARPQPELLDLLAQPDMAITRSGGGGPWRVAWSGQTAVLTPPAPQLMAGGTAADAGADVQPAVLLWGGSTKNAVAMFADGGADAVLGGRFDGWPLVQAAALPQTAVVFDPTQGLFGLAVVTNQGLLADAAGRNAVAMAIDRSRIIAAINAPGWSVRNSVRSPASTAEPTMPEWDGMSIEDRRARARAIVAAWRSSDGNRRAPLLRIALPDGPGARMLFAVVQAHLASVGIDTRRVALSAAADLRLIDEVAPTSDRGWPLRRLACGRGVSCDPDTNALVAAIDQATTSDARTTAFEAAESAIIRHAGFIPIATPLRWSLSSDRTRGLRPNLRGRHSLIRLRASPN